MKLKTNEEAWDEHISKWRDSRRALEYKWRIKREAIKDIIEIRNAEKDGNDFRIGDSCFYCQECASSSHVIDYIKWKFNITEGDIKSLA